MADLDGEDHFGRMQRREWDDGEDAMKDEDGMIGIDRDSNVALSDDAHWEIYEDRFGLVRHIPSGAEYRIVIPEEIFERGKLTVYDFRARLIKDGDWDMWGSNEVDVGKAAIIVFLIASGNWEPNRVEPLRRCREPLSGIALIP